MLTLFLILYLAVLVVAALPRWSHSRNWGYYPCSAVMAVLATVLSLSFV